MVRGNTSSGIYPPPAVDVVADISRISKLMELSVQEKGISIGGAVPITDFMVLLERNQSLSPSYGPLLKHLKRVSLLFFDCCSSPTHLNVDGSIG
jgi:hypothetical protein